MFIRGRWVRWGVPWESLGSSGVPWFIGMRAGGRSVHTMSLDSSGFALGVFGFILGCWVHRGEL